MDPSDHFHPHPSLLEGHPHPACQAIVIIPARNEEHTLPAALDALRHQVDLQSRPLDPQRFEIIVLLNNCTDASADAARSYQHQHPNLHLHFAERSLPPKTAHVGTARRMLMDTAFRRLEGSEHPVTAILSTDADTTVAPDWIARNLHAIERGADAVGGVIYLKSQDIALLDPGTLHAYRQDRRYQRNVARLESLLDPDPADPWPRHLEHFGASLACTPAAYRRAGGLPPVKPLEDVAFVDALRRSGARLRHAPDVCIHTSARLNGRADIGLSGQLRHWQRDAAAGLPHMVQSAASLAHRFSSLAQLRRVWACDTLPSLAQFPRAWREPLQRIHSRKLAQAEFLAQIDCTRLIEEAFHGVRYGQIARVITDLDRAITRKSRQEAPPPEAASKCAPAHPTETVPFAATAPFATPAG